MAAVAITRTDLSAAELRTSATRMKDARAVRRTLAIALVLDGTSRAAAARASGMDRQTLRDWVHRYNAGGLDGLSDQWAPGPEPALTRTQEQALIGWVELGPDLARDGVVRWRRADLRDRVLREFGVTVHERTVGKWLGQHGYCRLSVRPQHPKSDPAAQQAFKDDFADLVRATIPPEAAGKPVEIWWQDEARVGQQGTLTRVWARRGTRPWALRDQRRNSAYLFWRRLSRTRHGCCHHHAAGQHRGNERAPGRDQPLRDRRSLRGPGGRWCRMAHGLSPGRAAQPRPAAAASLRA